MAAPNGSLADTDLIGKWLDERAALLRKIEYRERELLELHEDYMALERDYNVLQRLWHFGIIRL